MMPSLFPPPAPLNVTGPRLELQLPGRWTFRLPAPLKSPNATMWSGRWALRAARQQWERELETSIATFATVEAALGWTAAERQAYAQLRRPDEKRAVRIWRLVPTSRNFLQDADNLDFAAKHLVDAMKRVGLIRNDNYAWLERGRTQEAIAPDAKFWTVVQLDRPDLTRVWRT